LWPETIQSLEAVIANRIEPRDNEYSKLVFLTRLGQPWVRFEMTETTNEKGKVEVAGKADDAISKSTAKLLKSLDIYRPGVTFYALRHTFETIAGGCRDQVAVDAVMGHVDNTMAAEYREHIEGDRLKAVIDHVRRWLYADTATKSTPAETKRAQPKSGKGPGAASRDRKTTNPKRREAREPADVVAEHPRLRIVG